MTFESKTRTKCRLKALTATNHRNPSDIRSIISAFAMDQRFDTVPTVMIACISPTKHDISLGTSAIVFYDLTLGYGSLFSDNLGIELIVEFSQFWPCGSKAKLDDFKEWMFSPRK
ncbi:hypothetical protein MBANPS3_010734 [Mucor bainieri]